MLKTYIKTAIRNLLRYPFFSVINISALAISISFCLIVVAILKGQYEYDSFQSNKERIYRIVSSITDRENNRFTYATSPAPLGNDIIRRIPSVEEAACVTPIGSVQASYLNGALQLSTAFTNSSLFKIFELPLTRPSLINEFDQPNLAIVSKEAALRLFHSENPIGLVFSVEQLGDFKVVDVVDLDKVKTHINYEVYLSSPSLRQLEANRKIDLTQKDWVKYTSSFTYCMIANTKEASAVRSALLSVSMDATKLLSGNEDVKSISFQLQNLLDITPSRGYILDNSPGFSKNGIYFISLLVFVFLCLTCFNYSNITVARALTRTKEIGVRKVMGASRFQVFMQFVVESIVVSFLAMLLACVILPFIPLNDAFRNLFRSAKIDSLFVVLFILFSILTGLLAGVIPGTLLSKLKTIQVLQNLSNLKILKASYLYRFFAIVQFAICGIIIMVLFSMYRQNRFMATADYGFNYTNVVNVPVSSAQVAGVLQAELSNLPGVTNISGISANLGYHPSGYCELSTDGSSDGIESGYYFVDDKTVGNFGLDLVAGSDFKYGDAERNEVIINELAAKRLGFKNNSEAIGKFTKIDDTLSAFIAGVVRDFHFENFKHPIQPMLLRYDPGKIKFLNVRIEPAAYPEILQSIKKKAKLAGVNLIDELQLMDVKIKDEQYHMQDILFISYIAIMLLTVCCLGVLGMAAYSAETRTKEISIRKLLGAGFGEVVMVLSKEYLVILLTAMTVAVPIGIIVSKIFLNNFAYRVSVDALSVVYAVMLVLLVGFTAFGSQIVKTAFVSPVKRLRAS